MVLHELATNAAKHGALKSKSGKVKVEWRQEHIQKARVLHFAWEEIVGLSEGTAPTEGTGFGTALIDSTIANLRGHIDRDVADRGISVRFWVPIL
jgi:two-component sensor histidine kinase